MLWDTDGVKYQKLCFFHLQIQHHKSHKMNTEHYHILAKEKEFPGLLIPFCKNQDALQGIYHDQKN